MTDRDTGTQRVTATGIRLVGSRALELASEAATRLAPPAPGDVLWISRFRARPRMGSGSPVPALLQELGEVLRQDWDACPAVTRDIPICRPTGKFHGLVWDTEGEPGAWRGELVWRHPHPVQAGTPCITHLVIDEQQQNTTITITAAADGGLSGVRGLVGAGQARPTLLDALRRAVTLTADGSDGRATILSGAEVNTFVRDVMLSDTRTWPVAVLAPHEDEEFVVPPELIADELFGLAPLYVIGRHVDTFRLTDSLGDKRLSVYFGAFRVYRPDFSCADRSDDHWLLLRDRLEDPVERAILRGKLGQFVSNRFLPVAGVGQWRDPVGSAQGRPEAVASEPHGSALAPTPDLQVTPPGEGDTAAATIPVETERIDSGAANQVLAALRGVIGELASQVGELSGTIAHLVGSNARLSSEISRLRTTTAVRATGANSLERRLATIEGLLRPDEVEPEEAFAEDTGEDEDTGVSLVDVVRHAGGEFADALLILGTAEDAAGKSPFEAPEQVAAVLMAMADVARRRQEGGLESGLRAAFQELGIDYRSGIAKSTSDRMRQQYHFADGNGGEYYCPEHIAIGATYSPRRCLRIYFTSRAPSESRFVIGHVGRHLEVKSTN